MASIVPIDETQDEYRNRRFNELMDVRRTRHGRMVNTQTNYLKARGQNIQEELGQERFKIQRQNLELARVKALTDNLRQRAAIELKMQSEEHTVRALETLGKLDPSAPDYHLKLADLFHDNPLATRDPVIQDIVKNQLAVKDIKETTKEEALRFEAKQGSEYSSRYGINVIPFPEGHPMAGRIDWDATEKERLKRSKDAQTTAIAQLPAGAKPFEQTVSKTGEVVQKFRMPQEPKALPPDEIKTETKPSPIPGEPPITSTTVIKRVPSGAAVVPGNKPPLDELFK